MPDKQLSNLMAFFYMVAAISGASGGCLVAAHHVLRGRSMPLLYFVSYGFVGLVFGLVGIVLVAMFTKVGLTLERTFLIGLLFGFVGSSALAGTNWTFRVILKRLGVEVDVNVRKVEEPKP